MKTNGKALPLWKTESRGQEGVCSVVVVYADTVTRNCAVQVCQRLSRRFAGEIEFEFTWWKFKFLHDFEIARAAVRAATRADIVLVSARAGVDVTREIQPWMELWVRRRSKKLGALAVQVDGPNCGQHRRGSRNRALRELARTAGMGLLLSAAHAAPSARECFAIHIHRTGKTLSWFANRDSNSRTCGRIGGIPSLLRSETERARRYEGNHRLH